METSGKVKLKSEPYEYMLYDGKNYEKIQEFIGKYEYVDPYYDKCLRFWTDSGARIVRPGSYFVKDENGIIFTYSETDFKKLFEPLDVTDFMRNFILYSDRHCNEDECFVMDYPHQMMATDKIPMKRKRSDLADADNYIRCVICHEPATQLDHLFPSDTMDNRCSKHARSLIDPCAWEEYGVAIEVCKEHYDMSLMRERLSDRLDWLDKNDRSVIGNVLRDKLVAALKELDSYMKTTWPSERMGPKKENG